MLVTLTTGMQLVLCTLAAYAFARYDFRGKGIAFALILMQLMIMPDVLVVENYSTMSKIGVLDSTLVPSACRTWPLPLAYFCCARHSKACPRAGRAAAVEGANTLQVLWHVYVPLAKPTYAAYALVSISTHWNNFLWPLIVTNSVNSPADRGFADILCHRARRGLDNHHRCHAYDIRPAADGIFAIPTAVCAVVHAGWHQVDPAPIPNKKPQRSPSGSRWGFAYLLWLDGIRCYSCTACKSALPCTVRAGCL